MMRRFLKKKRLLVIVLIYALFISSLSTATSYAVRDKKAPTSPKKLRATSVTDKSVLLAWDPYTDLTSPLYNNAVGSTNNGLYQTYSGSASISYKNIVGNYL